MCLIHIVMLYTTIVKDRAFPTRFSESSSPMTNDKFSMTNSQFRLTPLVAALPLWVIRGFQFVACLADRRMARIDEHSRCGKMTPLTRRPGFTGAAIMSFAGVAIQPALRPPPPPGESRDSLGSLVSLPDDPRGPVSEVLEPGGLRSDPMDGLSRPFPAHIRCRRDAGVLHSAAEFVAGIRVLRNGSVAGRAWISLTRATVRANPIPGHARFAHRESLFFPPAERGGAWRLRRRSRPRPSMTSRPSTMR